MTVSERMSNAGLVPVVVLENAADAVPTARAILQMWRPCCITF